MRAGSCVRVSFAKPREDALVPPRLPAPFPAKLAALLAVSTAVLGFGVLDAVPALAQQPAEASRTGYATGPAGPNRGRPGYPDLDEGETAPDMPGTIPQSDPTFEDPETDPLDDRPRDGQRPALRDGDFSYPPEPTALRDGIVDGKEPEAPRDGVDPLVVDTRPREDIDAFENPPAGYDPLLFQIEDVEPFADRRTRRLGTLEPYDPVGIRIGSFVMFPELESNGAWMSNVLRSQKPESDFAFEARPSARIVSDWKRHALEVRGASTLSFYNELDSEDERGWLIEARGRLDLTRRTNVQAFAAHEVSQESRSAIDASTAGDRATLTQDRAGVTLNHRFNRLSLQLRGSVTDYQYGDVETGGGVTQSNEDRNYTETKEAVRATWELKPTLSPFAEVEVNQRRYDTVAVSDGIGRDSDGERYRVGLAFGNTGKILRGEVALGYGVQRPLDDRLSEIDGVLVDANLVWRPSELTSVAFNARSDVSETTTTLSGGVMTRSAGVEARHAFRTHLIGTAGLTWTNQNYSGMPTLENELRFDAGVEYFLSREASLFGRYRHTNLDSNSPGASYDSDEIRLGMKIRR